MATEAQYPLGYLEESKQQQLYTESTVFIVIVTVITALRFVSRYIAGVKWQVDDTLVVLSWVFYVAFVAVIIGMCLYPPRAKRQVDIPTDQNRGREKCRSWITSSTGDTATFQ